MTLAISVIAPAYNEELSIFDSVKALLALEYPDHEVTVVNDGSKDDTLGQLLRAFDMVPCQRQRVAQLQKTQIRRT